MGLWSKNLNRSKTGELRLEEDISGLNGYIHNFLYRFFNNEIFEVELIDNIMYLKVGGLYRTYLSSGRAKLKERSHAGMMRCLLGCVDSILVHTRDIQNIFFLRDKIQRNLDMYEQTHDLKDLYFV